MSDSDYVSHLSGISCLELDGTKMTAKLSAAQAAASDWIQSPESLNWTQRGIEQNTLESDCCRSGGASRRPLFNSPHGSKNTG